MGIQAAPIPLLLASGLHIEGSVIRVAPETGPSVRTSHQNAEHATEIGSP
jgi:hypothetical protein